MGSGEATAPGGFLCGDGVAGEARVGLGLMSGEDQFVGGVAKGK